MRSWTIKKAIPEMSQQVINSTMCILKLLTFHFNSRMYVLILKPAAVVWVWVKHIFLHKFVLFSSWWHLGAAESVWGPWSQTLRPTSLLILALKLNMEITNQFETPVSEFDPGSDLKVKCLLTLSKRGPATSLSTRGSRLVIVGSHLAWVVTKKNGMFIDTV